MLDFGGEWATDAAREREDSIKNHKKTLLRVYKTTSHTNKIRIVCVLRALLF